MSGHTPKWRAAATVILSRPSFNENDYGYHNSAIPERNERYTFEFECDSAEIGITRLTALIAALHDDTEKAKA